MGLLACAKSVGTSRWGLTRHLVASLGCLGRPRRTWLLRRLVLPSSAGWVIGLKGLAENTPETSSATLSFRCSGPSNNPVMDQPYPPTLLLECFLSVRSPVTNPPTS